MLDVLIAHKYTQKYFIDFIESQWTRDDVVEKHLSRYKADFSQQQVKPPHSTRTFWMNNFSAVCVCLCVHEKLSVAEASEEINFMFLNQNDVQYLKDGCNVYKICENFICRNKKGHFDILKFAFLIFMVKKFRSKLKEAGYKSRNKLITFSSEGAFLNEFGSSVYLFSFARNPLTTPRGILMIKDV